MPDQSGGNRGSADRRRRVLIAVMAALAGLGIVVPLASALLVQVFDKPDAASTESASVRPTPAPLTIKPLSVRPVVQVEPVAPEQCPPPAPTLPTDTLITCDVRRSARYTLGPEALQLQLTRVTSVLSPITNNFVIQVNMTPEAAQGFATFTSAHVNQQAAFVRGGAVVSAPQITEPIDSEALQLSGNLTAEESDQIVKLLRDGSY